LWQRKSAFPADVRRRRARDNRDVANPIPAARLPARRRARGPHPTTGEALRRRVLGERERIARTSRVREFVLGFQDGLLVPLAVVTGLAGAEAASATVVVGGLAEAAAGAVAMGTGAFLASQAENQLFQNEIADEEHELADHPEVERRELEILLREEGLDEADASAAAEIISRSPRAHAKTKVEKELGLPYGEPETALGDALVTGGMYLLAAVIPLWPYFFWSVSTALVISLAATGVALFALGLIKGRVVGMALLKSGTQVLLVGGTSAAIGWLIGVFIPELF
jgi:VIT1/CCC1 family predicted Fe2+/Mn2+ transporter